MGRGNRGTGSGSGGGSLRNSGRRAKKKDTSENVELNGSSGVNNFPGHYNNPVTQNQVDKQISEGTSREGVYMHTGLTTGYFLHAGDDTSIIPADAYIKHESDIGNPGVLFPKETHKAVWFDEEGRMHEFKRLTEEQAKPWAENPVVSPPDDEVMLNELFGSRYDKDKENRFITISSTDEKDKSKDYYFKAAKDAGYSDDAAEQYARDEVRKNNGEQASIAGIAPPINERTFTAASEPGVGKLNQEFFTKAAEALGHSLPYAEVKLGANKLKDLSPEERDKLIKSGLIDHDEGRIISIESTRKEDEKN